MSKVLPKGTKLICPGCREYLAVSNRDIVEGEILSHGMFNFFEHRAPVLGEAMNCPWCNTSYGKTNYVNGAVVNELHTEDGWK